MKLKNFKIECLECKKYSEIKLTIMNAGILIECFDCNNQFFVKEVVDE